MCSRMIRSSYNIVATSQIKKIMFASSTVVQIQTKIMLLSVQLMSRNKRNTKGPEEGIPYRIYFVTLCKY